MKEVKTGAYVVNGKSVDFNYYFDLSYANKLTFVNSVVDLLVTDKHYNSVIRNLVFDFYVVDVFTDVDTVELKTSNTFVDSVEKFLEETDIADIVKLNVKEGLIKELNDAVDKNIEYLTGIHKNPLNEALADLMNVIEKKIGGINLDEMMDMATKFANMQGDFTPKNIVEAYTSTDAFKNSVKEIEEKNTKNNEALMKIVEESNKEAAKKATKKTTKTKTTDKKLS